MLWKRSEDFWVAVKGGTLCRSDPTTGEPLEVGALVDDEGMAIIHAMPARAKFLKGWWTR